MTGVDPQSHIHALVLAAGQSRRMGAENKLLLPWRSRPLITHVVEAAVMSRAQAVTVVLGAEAENIREALKGLNVNFVVATDHAKGMGHSLSAGIAYLNPQAAGAIICLGDMPLITARHLDALIEAYQPHRGHEICVPLFEGKAGNPVLWGRRFFEDLAARSGDHGAKALLKTHQSFIRAVVMSDDAILRDIDDREDLRAITVC